MQKPEDKEPQTIHSRIFVVLVAFFIAGLLVANLDENNALRVFRSN